MEPILVDCELVTGEKAVGLYSGVKSEVTGSFLIESVRTEDGKTADYAWATNYYFKNK